MKNFRNLQEYGVEHLTSGSFTVRISIRRPYILAVGYFFWVLLQWRISAFAVPGDSMLCTSQASSHSSSVYFSYLGGDPSRP